MIGQRPLRVTQIVTTLARGGAQATVVASAHDLDPGTEVSILTGPDSTAEGTYWGDPALASISVELVDDLVRAIRPVNDVRAVRSLIDRLRRDRPDVVHTHSSKAGVLGRLAAVAAGIPCVHTVHGWGPLDVGGAIAGRAVVAVERLLARRTAALVTVGQADLERGLELGIGRPDQYRLIRSGIDLPWPVGPDRASGHPPDRNAVRAELALEGRWVVGMVGRMAAQKDQALLIEAFGAAGMDDATLVLVGDGPTRGEIETAAGRWPHLDIRLLGARPDGARLVAGFDVAVNASRWEGLPRTVVEAAANGVPVVATDVGATGELIRPRVSGHLVRPGHAEGLTEALLTVRSDAAATREMAAEARRMAEGFSADRMRRDLVELWHDVAGRSGDRNRAESAEPVRPTR